jgi:4-phosphopantoate--beta-alanine ligase
MNVVTPSGLCAHGRGEAFDYLIGEKTTTTAELATRAAISALLTAKYPVISVNGNIAALVPEDLVNLSNQTKIPLEINLFYRTPGRVEAIENVLKKAGAKNILGTSNSPQTYIKELSSNRRIVDPRGIAKADVVLVPLEDGDRTEALVKEGKFVIAIDLNPLSRTAKMAQITIVDNVIRVIPRMITLVSEIKKQIDANPAESENIKAIVNNFDQKQNLVDSLKEILTFIQYTLKSS